MLLHLIRIQLRGSRRHHHMNQPARSRALRPLREDLEPRTLLTVDFYPRYGAENAVDYGGLKLDSPEVFLIFWGSSYWTQTSPGQQLESTIINDTETLIGSPYFSGLTQYNVDGHLSLGGWTNSNASGLSTNGLLGFSSSTFSSSTLYPGAGTVIQGAIDSNSVPAPNTLPDNPIYVVVTPPGASESDNPVAGSNNTAYYDPSNNQLVLEGVWLGSGLASSPSSEIDQYTAYLSHELVEAITDPLGDLHPGAGIFVTPGASDPTRNLGASNQIADYDAQNYRYRLGGQNGILVQSYWSQRDGAFIVPDGSPQTVWVDGSGSLWVLPDQTGSYFKNFVSIGVVNNGLEVLLDSSRFWFEPGDLPNGLSGIVAGLTGANDVIFVNATPSGCPVIIDLEAPGCGVSIGSGFGSGVSGIQSNLTIEFYSSDANVSVDDGPDTSSVDWFIQNGSISWGIGVAIDLWGQGGNGNSVTIDGGSGGNKYIVDNGPGSFPSTINTGNGSDYVQVVDSGGGLTVNTGSSTNNVVIGDQGWPIGPAAANLDGNVTVDGGRGGTTNVTIDDSSDTSSRYWNIQGNRVSCGGAGTISLRGYGNTVTIDGGSNSNSYAVDDAPGAFPTTLNTGNGDDSVSVADSAGGLTVNTGSGGSEVVIGGPTGADAAYLDGNVTVSGGSGGTSVFIYDFQNTTPTTWYYTNRLYFSGGLIHVTTTFWPSGSPDSITLTNNISLIEFWASSTDTLDYWSLFRLGGLAAPAFPGTGSGTAGGMSPLPPARQATAGPDPLLAGATGSDSSLHDLALESLLAEWPSSNFPALGSSPLESGSRTRTV